MPKTDVILLATLPTPLMVHTMVSLVAVHRGRITSRLVSEDDLELTICFENTSDRTLTFEQDGRRLSARPGESVTSTMRIHFVSITPAEPEIQARFEARR